MALTHSDIAPAANRGEAADAGNLYTSPGAVRRYDSYFSHSWMPRPMSLALDALAAEGTRADQTIFSFMTPIAMRFGDVWIMAESNYSSRTSQQISKLGAGWRRSGLDGRIERVPGDVSLTELKRVIAGLQHYVLPNVRHGVGRWIPGPNFSAE